MLSPFLERRCAETGGWQFMLIGLYVFFLIVTPTLSLPHLFSLDLVRNQLQRTQYHFWPTLTCMKHWISPISAGRLCALRMPHWNLDPNFTSNKNTAQKLWTKTKRLLRSLSSIKLQKLIPRLRGIMDHNIWSNKKMDIRKRSRPSPGTPPTHMS